MISRSTLKALSLVLVLGISMASCREVIPVAPQFAASNALDYFWNGTPYNPSYDVTDSGLSFQNDQLNLRSSSDSIVLTDGLGSRHQLHFSLWSDSVKIDQFAANKLIVLPDGYYFSNGSGPTQVTQPVHVRSVFYDNSLKLLFAGTDSNGIWYTSNGVNGTWIHSSGATHAAISGFARTEDSAVFAIGADSVYLSVDQGRTFTVIAEGRFNAIAARGHRVFFGGNDVEEIVRPSSSIHLFTPQLPVNFTSSILSLAVCGERLIAGVYQSSSTNHLLTIPIGGNTWESPPQQPITSTNMFALIANAPRVFAGTNGDSVIVSSDSGRNWRPFASTKTGANITAFASSASSNVDFAGTSDGLLLSLYVTDTGNVSIKTSGRGRITSLAVESANGYRDTVVMAGDTLSYWTPYTNPTRFSSPVNVITVNHPGRLKLLDASNGGLRMGASWDAGYLSSTYDTIQKKIVGRVIAHLDSLVLPLKNAKAPRKDVIVLRYAIEDAAQNPVAKSPYWIFYFEKGFGPVIIDLLETDPLTMKPAIVHSSVYDPPA